MKVVRRLLSWLLAITMIVGVLQTNTVTAFASGKDSPEKLNVTSINVVIVDAKTGARKSLSNDSELHYGDKIYLTLNWSINNGTRHTTDDWFSCDIDGIQLDATIYDVPATDTGAYPDDVAQAEIKSKTDGSRGSTFYLNYTDSDFLTNEDNISGSLTLQGTISADDVEDQADHKATWKFPNGVTYTPTVKRDDSNDGLSITKKFDSNYSSLTNREVTIEVKSTGDNDNVVVADEMGSNLSLVSDSIKVDGTPIDSQQFPVSLGAMTDGETKTITYKVDIASAAMGNQNEYNQWSGLTNASNKASVTTDGEKEQTATAEPRVEHKWVDKSYDDNGDTITWTVVINASGANGDLDGAYIKDTLGKKQELVEGSFRVSPANSQITKDNFFSGVRLSGSDTGSYTITYETTKDKSGAGKKTYTNDLEFQPKDGNKFKITSSLPGEGTDPGVSKSYEVKDETHPEKVTYTATVTIPAGYGAIEGATFTDTCGYETMQVGDVQLNGQAIDVTKNEKGNGFTYIWDIPESESEQTYTFTYDVEITDPQQWQWYGNNASFQAGEFTASKGTSYQYQPYEEPAASPEASKYKNSDSNGVVEWKVQVADASMITSTDKDLVLIDTLPDGMEYVSGSAQLIGYNAEYTWQKDDPITLVPVKGTDSDGKTTLTFTLPAEALDYFVRQEKDANWNAPAVYYKTKVTDISAMTGDSQTFTNKAQWQLGDEEPGKEGTADYTFNKNNLQMLSKSRDDSQLSSGKATYTIKVNESALKINGGAIYSVEDKPGKGIDIDVSTVKVTGDGKSHAVGYVANSDGTHTLTVEGLQDATSYTITYTANLVHTSINDFLEADYSNSVNLKGASAGSWNASDGISFAKFSAIKWTKGDDTTIKFYKTDSQTHEGLQGAAFTLYEIEVKEHEGNTITKLGDPVQKKTNITSDASGYVTIAGLTHDKIYKLVETQAPTGYQTPSGDDANTYFVFTGQDNYDFKAYAEDASHGMTGLIINESGYTPAAIEITNDEGEDTRTEVSISKKAISGSDELAGAELKITRNGKLVESWTSGTDKDADTQAIIAHKVRLEAGTYTLTEVTAPDGYAKAESITFTIDADGNVTSTTEGAVSDKTVTMYDNYAAQEVVISKQDIAGHEIAGAKLTVTHKDSENQDVTDASWTSVEGQSKTISLVPGDYTLTETTAPAGYEVATDIEFRVAYNAEVGQAVVSVKNASGEYVTTSKVVMIDEATLYSVAISKQNIADGSELSGAKLSILDEDGNVVEDSESTETPKAGLTWTSESTPKTVKLAPGKYYLQEDQAPTGYQKTESIAFTVNADGSVTSAAWKEEAGGTNGKLVMTDASNTDNKKEVLISKADLAGKEIAGATLIVTDSEGNRIDKFETDGATMHPIYVEIGNTYTLTEITVPDGYEKAEDITFTVVADTTALNGYKVTIGDKVAPITADGDNSVPYVRMTDNWKGTKVTISKADIAGNELAGATLRVYHKETQQKEGSEPEVVEVNDEIWVSDGTNHSITLTPGTYYLEEKSAPKGYTKAETIEFTVDATGVASAALNEDGVIVMTDNYADQIVKISKVDATTSKEIVGAKLTVTDSDNKVVASTTTDGSLWTFTVQPGTYTLTETTAPDGYEVAESITFTVDNTGKCNMADASGIIVMKDEPSKADTHEVSISKRDLNGEEIDGATLTISEKVDGKWTSLMSFDTDGKTEHKVYLEAGTYRLTETTVPDGYVRATAITFTVDENGEVTSEGNMKDGSLVMVDEWSAWNVDISKQDILGSEIAGAQLRILDEKGQVVDDQLLVSQGKEGDQAKAQWTSGSDTDENNNIAPHTVRLLPGTYVLHEVSAPKDSSDNALYEVATDITFTIDAHGNVTSETASAVSSNGKGVVMVDKYLDTEVEFSKVDATTKAEIDGATLTITGKTSDGEPIEPITFGTDGVNTHKFKLQPGEYLLTETQVPLTNQGKNKYEKADSIEFQVEFDAENKTYKVVSAATTEGTKKVTMEDKQIAEDTYLVPISKRDVAGNEVQNATLTISGTPTSGEEFDAITFKTDGVTEHQVYVPAGTYTLTESYEDPQGTTVSGAPEGYKKAQDITFTVDATGKITSNALKDGGLVMVDQWEYQKVQISKQDIAGEEVVGAELEITGEDAAGNPIQPKSWTSTGKVEKVSLLPGNYTLTETLAPDGYQKSSSIDFDVDVNGKVYVSGKETAQVTMTDKWEDVEVEISKADVGGKEIKGAVLTITGTTQDGQDAGTVSFQTDGVRTHKFSLQPGTYTLTETTVPNGFERAESVQFTVEVGGTVKRGDDEVNKVVMTDAYTERTITVSKQDIANGKELAGALLTIMDTKSNEVIDSWRSTTEDHEVTYAWNANSYYVLKEVSAPSGYDLLTTSIVFRVSLTGEVSLMTDNKYGVVAEDGTLVINNTATPEEPYQGEPHKKHEGPSTTTVTNNSKPMIPKFHVYLVRTDEETGEGLEGGVYELHKEDGELVGTYTTNEAGVIYVDDLEPGTYYFVEIVPPEGYEASPWTKVFTVGEDVEDDLVVAVASLHTKAAEDDFNASAAALGIGTTGDDSNMVVYAGAAAMAAAVLVLWVIKRRKRQSV